MATFDLRIVLIDNYDSFTYNLCQYISVVSPDVRVFRNDEIDVRGVAAMRPDAIVISPGPKGPADAGISIDVIRWLGRTRPILGVCLGHQCINEAFGGRTVRAPRPWHGKTSAIRHDGAALFAGLPQGFAAARYHSLVADADALGTGLRVSAWTDDGLVMGLRHERHPIEGVQFHPESFMTEHGRLMVHNFLAEVRRGTCDCAAAG